VIEEILHRRGTTLVRRMRLAPGETTPWHRDPFHRVSVLLGGDLLAIEFRDNRPRILRSSRRGKWTGSSRAIKFIGP
jgi:hypothetical protein